MTAGTTGHHDAGIGPRLPPTMDELLVRRCCHCHIRCRLESCNTWIHCQETLVSVGSNFLIKKFHIPGVSSKQWKFTVHKKCPLPRQPKLNGKGSQNCCKPSFSGPMLVRMECRRRIVLHQLLKLTLLSFPFRCCPEPFRAPVDWKALGKPSKSDCNHCIDPRCHVCHSNEGLFLISFLISLPCTSQAYTIILKLSRNPWTLAQSRRRSRLEITAPFVRLPKTSASCGQIV